MLAGAEVLGLDGLLGFGDALGDQARLDGDVLLHAEPQHQALDAVAAEDAEQVVLQGEVEAGTAGVALAAGAPTELVVDAAGVVALGAHDVQAPQGNYLVVLAFGLGFVAGEDLIPLRMRHAIEVPQVVEIMEFLIADKDFLADRELLGDLLLEAGFLGHELRIAAQEDVRAAAGHVGGNRNHALAPGLRHDVSLALVLLGVQHFVLDAHLLEARGEPSLIFRPRWFLPAPAGPFPGRT